jgi:hypothetical protein
LIGDFKFQLFSFEIVLHLLNPSTVYLVFSISLNLMEASRFLSTLLILI